MALEVELVPVLEEDKAILANMLQLYRHDLSEFRGYRVTEHGTFVYRFLDHYWTESGRYAYFIRSAGELAGFALVRQLEPGEHEMAEFFALRAYRRRGVSRQAALALFGLFPGRWVVFHDDANTPAARFWAAVVAEASGARLEPAAVTTSAGFVGREYRFTCSVR